MMKIPPILSLLIAVMLGLIIGDLTGSGAIAAYINTFKLLDTGGVNVAGVNASGQVAIQPIPAGTGNGTTPYHLAGGTAATNNSTSIKGSAGNLMTAVAINTTTTLYYLRFYDSASAPTCSSATNLKHTYPVPPAPASGQAGGFVVPLPVSGESYTSGIGFCVTGAAGDADNTNAATGIYIEASYK